MTCFAPTTLTPPLVLVASLVAALQLEGQGETVEEVRSDEEGG